MCVEYTEFRRSGKHRAKANTVRHHRVPIPQCQIEPGHFAGEKSRKPMVSVPRDESGEAYVKPSECGAARCSD